ncbi:MAG TPA: hypothetical protein PKD85_00715, partial [Saprospiraceae bacterium]|nr:hypothetical protein [Saprospiraceae bacterium]
MDDPSTNVTKKSTSKKDREAFNAIFSFVGDIWDLFGQTKKVDPLVLYHRLISNTKLSDTDSIEKIIAGFKAFLTIYNDDVLKLTLDNIPKGTKIQYGTSERIYLDIQKFIHRTKNDEDSRQAIRDHLLNISCIIEPNSIKMAELEKLAKGEITVDTSTKEGAFINSIMQKAKAGMKNVDANNPMAAMAGIFQSGVVQDMMKGLQEGVASGDMKMDKLLGSMQSAIGSVLPAAGNMGGLIPSPEEDEELKPPAHLQKKMEKEAA